MLLTGVFTENGSYKTGLTPTIKIYDADDNSMNQASMIEYGTGFYNYDFTSRDVKQTNPFICDSPTLSLSERYAVGLVEPDYKRDYCIAYVSELGLPETGLVVFLSLYNLTDSVLVSAGNMDEIGFGFYKYSFPWDRSKIYGFIGDTGLTADESWIYGLIEPPLATGVITYPMERDVRRNVAYGPNGARRGLLRPGGGSFNMPKKPDDEEVMKLIKTFMETGLL
ncbi:unnamed protein product [marine sediment metagenome]|uniref:Uncharacterized protein n=1 Tax=marine sediment metagenome TaxID=412755 RepID=X0TSZ4_9ZZZZ